MNYLIDKENKKLIIRLLLVSIASFALAYIYLPLGIITQIVLLFLITFSYFKNRDTKVNSLTQYLKHLNQGDYQYDIEAYQEGELSKLQSELNKTTISLQQMNNQIIQQHDTLQQALEDISHQLKTPIASLMLLNELQEKDELVDKSNEQIQRLSYLVDSLLRLVKLDAGLEIFEYESFKLDHLVDSAMMLILANQPDIKFKIEVESLQCYGDFQKSKEALLNVLYNKLRHAKTSISLKSKSEHMSSLLVVEDDGDSVINRARVFERFYTGDKKDPMSIGIGLAIAKEFMKEQNGSLTLEEENAFVFRFNKL